MHVTCYAVLRRWPILKYCLALLNSFWAIMIEGYAGTADKFSIINIFCLFYNVERGHIFIEVIKSHN